MKKILMPLLGAILVLAGCKSDKTDPVPLVYGFDYYPIQTGDYRVHEITEIRQLGDTSHQETTLDTTRYQLREVIDSAFTDLENEEYFRIYRHRRNNSTETWQEDSVFVVKKTNARLERVENNRREVKLVFPMSVGRTWNLNMLNPEPERQFVYRDIDKPYTLNKPSGDTLFSQTALIEEVLDSTAIQAQRYSERYAKGVGLIETSRSKTTYNSEAEFFGLGIIVQANYKFVRLLERGRQE